MDDHPIIDQIRNSLKRGCNRYSNGVCMSAICLSRGGHTHATPPNYDVATCEVHEQVVAFDALVDAGKIQVETIKSKELHGHTEEH